MTNPTLQSIKFLKLLRRRFELTQGVSTRTSNVQVRSTLSFASSGFPVIDGMTGGFWPGDLIVIAASPCMGKTALVLNIAEQVALAQGLPVAIFSTDMGVDQTITRMAASIGRISLDHLRTGKLTEYEVPRLATAIADLSDARLHVSASSSLSIDTMQTEASDFFRTSGCPGLIVIDHLQLVPKSLVGGNENNEETGSALQRLKTLSTELRCPIIVLSPLPAGVEMREYKRPTISDLGSASYFERYADIVMLLYRDHFYTGDECNEPGLADVIFVKQRGGSNGLGKLVFLEQVGKFESLAYCS